MRHAIPRLVVVLVAAAAALPPAARAQAAAPHAPAQPVTPHAVAPAKVAGHAAVLHAGAAQLAAAGDAGRAITQYQAAYAAALEEGDRPLQAQSLAAMGSLQLRSGNRAAATVTLREALPRQVAIGDRAREADVLRDLADVSAQRSHGVSVFLAKQHVLAREGVLRGLPPSAPPAIRRAAAREVILWSRQLAKALADENRDAEGAAIALRVKSAELAAYLPARDLPPPRPIPLTPREKRVKQRWDSLSTQLVKKGQWAQALRGGAPPQGGEVALKAADAEVDNGIRDFLSFLDQIQDELPPGRTEALKDKLDLQNTLVDVEAGAVAVVTNVGTEHVISFLITPDRVSHYTSRLRTDELLASATHLRGNLQDPRVDAAPLAEALFADLFPGLGSELSRASTIYWSLDAWLRYLPMPALRYERRWLAERWRNVLFTEAGDLTHRSSDEWTVLGLGASQDLPGVRRELEIIVRTPEGGSGLLDGWIHLDGEFRDDFGKYMTLSPRVVHFATHYHFKPVLIESDDKYASYLVLGDGDSFTMMEMYTLAPSTFRRVELVALSACDTAVGVSPGADPAFAGAEVDSLAVTVQRKGAAAVLATLWPVSDDATPEFARRFYDAKRRGKTKAAALQEAQLAFVGGCVGPGADPNAPCAALAALPPTASLAPAHPTGGLFAGCAPPPKQLAASESPAAETRGVSPATGSGRWTHPFYWAPFILLGNGN